MLNRMLSDIARITGGQHVGNDALVTSIVVDSRAVKSGSLFVAMKGEHVDGHEFLNKAAENGAAGAIVEVIQENALLPQIKVVSAIKALAEIAEDYRKSYQGVIVSITGSCGKTSTKEMLVSILAQKAKVVATKGNQNNEIGVPLTVFNLDNDSPYAVVEMGAAQQGDIAYLMTIAQPDVTAITNVRSAHIGRFGSEAIIATTKAEIYRELKSSGKAAVNLDEKYAQDWLALLDTKDVVTYSLENNLADIYATDIALGADSASFNMHVRNTSAKVNLPVPGIHNIANALCATACAVNCHISLEQMVIGLQQFKPAISRLQKLQGSWGGVLIDDCYNANPASVKAAIDVLAQYDRRKIFVLGNMAELGDDTRSSHEDVGRYAKGKIDLLITCGTDSEFSGKAFGSSAIHFFDKKSVIDYLLKHLQKQDVVLVKGSRSAALEEVINGLKLQVSTIEAVQ